MLPSENIIYFGDTSRVPYGGRSPEILLKYARQDVHFLRSFDIKASAGGLRHRIHHRSAPAAGGKRPARSGGGGARLPEARRP